MIQFQGPFFNCLIKAATILVALNTQLLTGTANFSNIVATYSDITNKFTLTCPFTSSLGVSALSMMDYCVGFQQV